VSRAFDRLDPALQYQIAYGLGFHDLRPVQEMAVDAILDGANAVILAPTAGGKTEAAFFPLLSMALAGNWPAPSILYVTPIKALINNQEERLTHLTGLVGRRAFKWHGDVADSRRRAFLREPADVLLTTPESLEAMLISRRVSNEAMFGNLRAVVIDEVHAFAGDDRGGHLSSVLERISRFAGRDLQRVGLSATVGNPPTILDWMQGSSGREKRLVDPPRPSGAPQVELDFVGTLTNAALVIEKLHPGKKRLVFADSRRKVESLGRALDERGVRAFVMHSSLSAAERSLAEREFAEGRNCVIVATSAMELGIDVGDLDHVLQIDSPRTVASFLQRMGRTGRRPGATPNCTFLCTEPEHVLQAAALIELQRAGFVEPVVPVTDGAHLLAHQLLAISLQEGGVSRAEFARWLAGSAILQNLDSKDLDQVLEHMLSESFVVEVDGRICFGPHAERLYGAKNFLELYAVFETSQDFKVFHGRNEIGELSPLWVAQKGQVGSEFTLGGKPWMVRAVEHARRRIDVTRGQRGGSIGWVGRPLALGFELCQQIGALLRGEGRPAGWTDRAMSQIEEQRDAFAAVPADGIERTGSSFRWHTFAGAGANMVLAALIEEELGATATYDNLSIGMPSAADGGHRLPHSTAARALQRGANLSAADVARLGRGLDPELLGKFAPCLPPTLRSRVLATRLLDLHALARVGTPGLLEGADPSTPRTGGRDP
jgi:ATP-dependent Lhr-like helicase